jgi:hypothetical protein
MYHRATRTRVHPKLELEIRAKYARYVMLCVYGSPTRLVATCSARLIFLRNLDVYHPLIRYAVYITHGHPSEQIFNKVLEITLRWSLH